MPTLDDPIAIEVFGFEIRWYALFILAGIFAALAVSRWLALRRNLDPEFLLDAAPWLVVSGIIGARLYYVALKWRFFVDHPGEIASIREGGLAVHGAIAGGTLAFWLYCRYRRQPVLQWGDLFAASVPFGQAIGRWGNWANQEAFGRPSDLPWAMEIDPDRRPAGYEQFTSFHPTFLYESILDLLLGVLLVMVVLRIPTSRRLRTGDAIWFYLIGYGIVRFIVESFRLDSVYIDGLRVAHLASLLLVAIGSLALLLRRTVWQDDSPVPGESGPGKAIEEKVVL